MGVKLKPANRLPDLSNFCAAITEHAPLPMATVEGATHIVRYVTASNAAWLFSTVTCCETVPSR